MNKLLAGAALAAVAHAAPAPAEPYLAVREGLKCRMCHVNPTGGGMRSAFGTGYAQTALAAERIETVGAEAWSGLLDGALAVGGDLRTGGGYTDIPHQDAQSAFETEELRLYLAAQLLPDRLLLYADQRVAPRGSINHEAYLRLAFRGGEYYLKAGQIYLPYGLRLEDDGAFVREVPGINMSTPDNGVELGWERGSWSAQLALSNGSAGAAESGSGKQASLRAEFVHPGWRVGASLNRNDAEAGARRMANLFAGLRTGPLAWLAEADYVDDASLAGRGALWAGLLEGNWGWRRGHNVKASAEYHDPDADVDEDQQSRYSLVYEYTPFQFVQLRGGLRVYDGIPQNDLQNRRLLFVQLHGFF